MRRLGWAAAAAAVIAGSLIVLAVGVIDLVRDGDWWQLGTSLLLVGIIGVMYLNLTSTLHSIGERRRRIETK